MRKFFVLTMMIFVSITSFAGTFETKKREAEFFLEMYGDRAEMQDQIAYYECMLEEVDGLKCYGKFWKKASKAVGGALHDTVKTVGKGTESAVRGVRDLVKDTKIRICGQDLIVPTIMYGVCQGSVGLLPAGCTFGTVTTGGGACAAAIALVVSSCGVSIERVTQIAKACMNR